MSRNTVLKRLGLLILSFVLLSGLSAQDKPDALLLYRQGRDLETANKTADAQAKYQQSVSVCDAELAQDSRRIEAYVVKCWSLFRLGKHQEVINSGSLAMKIQFDARIAEIMGESYFYLGESDLALKSFQKFVDSADPSADRLPTAYFYMGEIYSRLRKYSHADIAYSMAVTREPSMPRWWFRLGLACENLGEWKRASDSYARALALSPDMQDAKDGQARVKPKLTGGQP
jgi:tetratricopeptide (TPR) repeat protein